MKRMGAYQWIMVILALLVVLITILPLVLNFSPEVNLLLYGLDSLIWLCFFVDYIVRLSASRDRMKFVTEHKIEILAIIPFHSFFRLARLFRVAEVLALTRFARVLRATAMLSTLAKTLGQFIKVNNFNYVLIGTIIVVLLGAGGISLTESLPFDDALWWSIVTVSTVGYGDIYPTTGLGRTIAAIIMLSGIGFLATLSGTIVTFFLNRHEARTLYTGQVITQVITQLKQFDELSLEELEQLTSVLKVIKQGQLQQENVTREKNEAIRYELDK